MLTASEVAEDFIARSRRQGRKLSARATPQSSGRLAIDLTDMKLFYRYPANDIFIRVVYGLCRALVRVGVYQVGLAVSRWVRKAWEAWKILCSFFCMAS
jgi:hypothetical protein